MGLSLTHEVLSLALRDPFRIARADHNEGARITTVIVELRDDRFPDVVGVGEGYPDRFYGETPDTMAVVMPMLLASIETTDIDYEVADAAAGLARIATHAVDPTIRGHGAAKCALDIALHDLVGKVDGQTGPRAARRFGRDPADRLHDRHRRAGDRRRARVAGGRLPGAQDQVRRAGRPGHAPCRPRGVLGTDPRRCQHRLEPRGRRGTAARARRPGRRADRAALPGPRLPRPRLAPGAVVAADRRRRERRHRTRTWTPSLGSWRA